ncbi:hypothetical protein Tco_1314726 [Tanacetum coccineum]
MGPLCSRAAAYGGQKRKMWPFLDPEWYSSMCVSEDSGDELEYLRELFLEDKLYKFIDTGCWLFLVAVFVSSMLGQMTYYVSSPTLDSVGSYVMQGAPFTQGTILNIPIGGSISPEDFLPSILLLVVERMHSTRIGHHRFLFLLWEFLLVQCSYWDLSAFAMVVACASRAAVIP